MEPIRGAVELSGAVESVCFHATSTSGMVGGGLAIAHTT